MASYVERMQRAAERLRDVTLECKPALEIIERYGGCPDTLIYADPPYLGTVRGSNYRMEMTSPRQHRELFDALNDCRATVVLSGYRSDLYDGMYAEWFRHEMTASTTQGNGDHRRVEVLWSNRETRHKDEITDASVTGLPSLCGHCFRVVPKPKRGPRGRWCSPACRTAAWRSRTESAVAG
jgi:DNA adenine methylase